MCETQKALRRSVTMMADAYWTRTAAIGMNGGAITAQSIHATDSKSFEFAEQAGLQNTKQHVN